MNIPGPVLFRIDPVLSNTNESPVLYTPNDNCNFSCSRFLFVFFVVVVVVVVVSVAVFFFLEGGCLSYFSCSLLSSFLSLCSLPGN